MNQRQPILVTGAHRSGTTWVGKMLAASGECAYVSEPLNVVHRPGVFRPVVPNWYTYITKENEGEYLPGFQDILAYRYHIFAELPALRSRKDLMRMGRDWKTFLAGRLKKQRILFKDPFAYFSIPWFTQRLNSSAVVVIRHPAAFASSLLRLRWAFEFDDLLRQPRLMRDWLGPYREEMRAMLIHPQDIVGQSGLLWRMIYGSLPKIEAMGQVCAVRHEDLSVNPLDGYRKLYARLGLRYTPAVEEIIAASSSSENPKELSRQAVHGVRLDSKANLKNWKKRLTPEDIARIRELTEPVASLYYSDEEWA